MPTIPQLVGSAEAAKILSISPTNFAHLRRNLREAGDTDFPEPVVTLSCGPIWTAKDIEKFKPTFEASRRRRRSSAEVAAEREAAKAAKAAETQPESDAEFEASAKKAPAKKAATKPAPAKRSAPKLTKSDGKANSNSAATTTSGDTNVTVQSNANKTPKPPVEGRPAGAANGKVPAKRAARPAGKAKLALVKS